MTTVTAAASRRGDALFQTDHLKTDLRRRSTRGGMITLGAQSAKFVIMTASSIVLARLLTPNDYGLVGMVAVFTGFVSMFKDLGLSTATVQRAEITREQISTLFWINFGISVALAALVAALAPAVAWFYHEPRLVPVTVVVGLSFLLGGIAVQHQALLQRQMRFAQLAAIDVASLLVGFLVAASTAWNGAGYWALVYGQIATGATTAIGVWVFCRWLPGRPVRRAGVRPMLRFGGNIMGFSTTNYFSRNADNALIGRYWGAQQLGLYAKAYQLLLLPIQQINAPISAVAIPTLSRLADSPERYRQAYCRVVEKLAILTMPGVMWMTITADWLVRVVLGDQWVGAARIFSVLGVMGLLQPVSGTTGWLFTTQDRTREYFRWGLIGGGIAVASIVAGLPWGAYGVAVAYASVGVVVRTPLLYWYVGRRGPVGARHIYAALVPAATATLFVMVALLLFRHWTPGSAGIAALLGSLGIAFVVTLTTLLAFPHGRRLLADGQELLSDLVRSRR